MNDFTDAGALAAHLILSGDPTLYAIVALSLEVSVGAALIAGVLGAFGGVALAIFPFAGRRLLVIAANSLLGLPPVLVGLVAYLLLSRQGLLGNYGLLYTPTAMVIVQAVLAFPIVTAIVHRAAEEAWAAYGESLTVAGATRLQALPQILRPGQRHLVTALLAGFGRTISEVGAIIIVGGNIAGATRTMTTAIALQTSMGNLPMALALGLVLIILSVVINFFAFAIADDKKDRL
jgi:tungstate transport system permease protein